MNNIQEFNDRLADNYIFRQGTFSPSFSDSISSRMATNAIPFHANFNRSFSSSRPNTFVFIKILTELRIDTYKLMRDNDTRPSTTRYRRKINEIENYIDLYAEIETINRSQFLNSIRYDYYKQ